MQLLETEAREPAEDLAIDDALLVHAVEQGPSPALLRLWEFRQPTVVLGRSSQVAVEVDVDRCREAGVAILRRTSGGCAIVGGPGCWMYTLILSCDYDPALGSIEGAHRWVLQRLAAALTTSDAPVLRAGTSDLVVELPSGIRKFSGNSLRLKQSVVMYHGTVLYDFPLELIGAYLHQPPREPTYREGRAHQNFVGNLPLSRCEIRAALIGAFDATGPAAPPPGPLVAQLVAEKYTRDHWNLRH